MKLTQKVFCFKDEANFEGDKVKVLVNGNDGSLKLDHLFKEFSVDDNEVTGYSLLEFYKIKDGNFVDEDGSVISFILNEKKISIIKVRDPFLFIDEDIEVNLQNVKDVSALLGLKEIEKTITALSDADKKILIEDREKAFTVKELAKKEVEVKEAVDKKVKQDKEAADKVFKDKETADAKVKEDAKKAEATKAAEDKVTEEAKEKEKNKVPEGDDIVSIKDFKLLQRKSQREGLLQYRSVDYLFFYGEDRADGKMPFVLIDMQTYYKRLDGSLTHEKNGEVEYEFTAEDETDKILILKNEKLEVTKL